MILELWKNLKIHKRNHWKSYSSFQLGLFSKPKERVISISIYPFKISSLFLVSQVRSSFFQIFLRPLILRHTQIKKTRDVPKISLLQEKHARKRNQLPNFPYLKFSIYSFFLKDEHWDALPSSNSRKGRFIVSSLAV